MNAIGPIEAEFLANATAIRNKFFPKIAPVARSVNHIAHRKWVQEKRELADLMQKYTWVGVTIEEGELTPKQILAAISEKHHVSIAEIQGARRYRRIVHARHEAMYELAKRKGWSTPRIGGYLGGKDHTTVLNGISRHTKRLEALEAL